MTDIKIIEVPKWGLSMEEGTLNSWLIEEGDSFRLHQEVCEIETSKIANVLEAPFAGVLRRKVAVAGQTLPVGGVLGVVADASVSDAEIDAFLALRSTGRHRRAAAWGGRGDTDGSRCTGRRGESGRACRGADSEIGTGLASASGVSRGQP